MTLLPLSLEIHCIPKLTFLEKILKDDRIAKMAKFITLYSVSMTMVSTLCTH